MKALVYDGHRSVRWQNVRLPFAHEGDVAVDVLQAGVCGTDMCAVRDGRPAIEPGMTLGHEFVGRRRDTGQLVVGNPLVACGNCRNCLRGKAHLCLQRAVIGVHRPGAFTGSVWVPESRLVPIDGASLEQAALVDPVATALHAFRLAPRPEGPVAVLGAGAIGLSLLFVLKSHGIGDITVTDLSGERLDLALAAGADRTGASADGVYDVVYDTVGSVATRRDAVLRTIPGGDAVLVGLHSAELQVAAGPVIGGERTIRGSFGYTDDEFREAAGMVSRLSTDWVQTVDFDDAEAAFHALLAGRSDARRPKLQMRMAR